jgi:hypothetical protein
MYDSVMRMSAVAGCCVVVALGGISRDAQADPSIVYKCKKSDDTLLYSDTPCYEQYANKLKVLRPDDMQRNFNDSRYDPAENPANRELTREERRKYFIPEAGRSENLTHLKGASAAESKAPVTDAKPKPTQTGDSWWSRALISIKRFFGISAVAERSQAHH